MNRIQPYNFGKGRFSGETEDLYRQFQKLFGISEPAALLIALSAVREAGVLAKQYCGRPKIRFLALKEPPNVYAMAVVKVCAQIEESNPKVDSPDSQLKLPSLLNKWVGELENACRENDGLAKAKKRASERIVPCPSCKQWKFNGKIEHLENCHSNAWDKVNKNQLSPKVQEELKLKSALKNAKAQARIGSPLGLNPPKKSKAHSYSNWPPIVSGGGIETNRKRH